MAKRKRPTGSKGKGKRAARSKGRAALFARAPSPVTPTRAIDQADSWKEWGRQRSEDPFSARRRQVRKILIARGVPSDLVARIVAIDPTKAYIIEIYGYAGSDPDDIGQPGDLPVRQAVFVGSGYLSWIRIVGYSAKAPIEHIEIKEIDPETVDRPLWDQYSVVTVSGVEVYGHGNLQEWKDRQKAGRRKKSGGGMNAAARRKNRKSKNAAIKRRQLLNQRVAQLRKTDPLAADRLLARARRSRKIEI